MSAITDVPMAVKSDPTWNCYWLWFGTALFLLIIGDLATTIGAAAVIGMGGEANPFMRWLFARGAAAVLIVHLVVVVLAVVGFDQVLRIGRRLEDGVRQQYRNCCEVWLVALITLGLALVINNLFVIAIGIRA